MKVIVDDKIPYIKDALEQIADNVIFVPGKSFTPEIVRDADALIIRTRTLCNKELLEGSSVKFIVTATIGFDHIDVDYCKEAGIVWRNAPGCNAASVAQYIQSVLLVLEQTKHLDLSKLTMGVVGIGNVGKKVVKVAKDLGLRVIQNDPPREHKGEKGEYDDSFVSLQQIIKESDIISFHVPLNKEGLYKTCHLADDDFFKSLKCHPVVINTSRGGVISTSSILSALKNHQISDAVLDVWENEPGINLELLDKVLIGTPHIAGYAADGKANATRMSLQSLCRYFGIEKTFDIQPPAPASNRIEATSCSEALLKIYDPRHDSALLKAHPEKFEYYRGNYPLRRQPEAYHIIIKEDKHL
jgi:erythronate-4-phosphate dehydrogenase